jgi:hypothetical protein
MIPPFSVPDLTKKVYTHSLINTKKTITLLFKPGN